MAPPAAAAAIHCFVLIMIVTASLLIHPSITIYCDEDDCYDLLGHPDKNSDPDSRKLPVKIANAYEVFYNTARYYHAYYGHKTWRICEKNQSAAVSR